MITSDHGNADKMMNTDGTPNTAHTTNPVPLILINPDSPEIRLNNGRLADIAPTILKLMDLNIPEEMSGQVLLKMK